MCSRCNSTKNKDYKDWGGRGVKVCKRWSNKEKGFQNFLFDMGERPGARYSIDRINNSKGYYKSNCRWSTGKEQCRNTRKNIMITYNGKTQCLAAWAEKYKINYQTLYSRLYESNWSIEKALIIPVKHKNYKQ